MNKKSLISLGLLIVILILEILPYGAVCIFATETETYRKVYSYFSGVPYGYANFGPFCTAMLTCVMLLLSTINLLLKKKNFSGILIMISISSVFVSILPLFSGIRYFTVIGGVITLLLGAVTACFLSQFKD